MSSQAQSPIGRIPEQNHLLLALPSAEYDSLSVELETVALSVRDVLYEPNGMIEHAWFPQRCVASLIAVDNSGLGVEVASIGKEGLVGMARFHESDSAPHRSIVQIAGPCKRIVANALLRQLPDLPTLRRLLQRYANALFNDAAQANICNRRHSFEQRCARWLLTTDDSVGGHDFALTQEFLSYMLATRRPTVSTAAARLQRDGLIRYTRGVVHILDRVGLEAAACECYAITQASHRQVYD
jgi:CRP-like cAMP-binding protein